MDISECGLEAYPGVHVRRVGTIRGAGANCAIKVAARGPAPSPAQRGSNSLVSKKLAGLWPAFFAPATCDPAHIMAVTTITPGTSEDRALMRVRFDGHRRPWHHRKVCHETQDHEIPPGSRHRVRCSQALLSPAEPSEIYKFTDEDGNVHYGDRPTGATVRSVSRRLHRRTRQHVGWHAQATQLCESYSEAREERRAAEKEEAADHRHAARIEKSARPGASRCRSRLETYLQANRLYREGAAGEREYLDDANHGSSPEAAEESVKENCA